MVGHRSGLYIATLLLLSLSVSSAYLLQWNYLSPQCTDNPIYLEINNTAVYGSAAERDCVPASQGNTPTFIQISCNGNNVLIQSECTGCTGSAGCRTIASNTCFQRFFPNVVDDAPVLGGRQYTCSTTVPVQEVQNAYPGALYVEYGFASGAGPAPTCNGNPPTFSFYFGGVKCYTSPSNGYRLNCQNGQLQTYACNQRGCGGQCQSETPVYACDNTYFTDSIAYRRTCFSGSPNPSVGTMSGLVHGVTTAVTTGSTTTTAMTISASAATSTTGSAGIATSTSAQNAASTSAAASTSSAASVAASTSGAAAAASTSNAAAAATTSRGAVASTSAVATTAAAASTTASVASTASAASTTSGAAASTSNSAVASTTAANNVATSSRAATTAASVASTSTTGASPQTTVTTGNNNNNNNNNNVASTTTSGGGQPSATTTTAGRTTVDTSSSAATRTTGSVSTTTGASSVTPTITRSTTSGATTGGATGGSTTTTRGASTGGATGATTGGSTRGATGATTGGATGATSSRTTGGTGTTTTTSAGGNTTATSTPTSTACIPRTARRSAEEAENEQEAQADGFCPLPSTTTPSSSSSTGARPAAAGGSSTTGSVSGAPAITSPLSSFTLCFIMVMTIAIIFVL